MLPRQQIVDYDYREVALRRDDDRDNDEEIERMVALPVQHDITLKSNFRSSITAGGEATRRVVLSRYGND